MRQYYLEDDIPGFPPHVGSCHIENIVEHKNIKIKKMARLEDEKMLLTVLIDFEALCTISASSCEYTDFIEVREFFDLDDDGFSDISVSLHEPINIILDIIVNTKTKNITSEEIRYFGTPYVSIQIP